MKHRGRTILHKAFEKKWKDAAIGLKNHGAMPLIQSYNGTTTPHTRYAPVNPVTRPPLVRLSKKRLKEGKKRHNHCKLNLFKYRIGTILINPGGM